MKRIKLALHLAWCAILAHDIQELRSGLRCLTCHPIRKMKGRVK
jgi:hypothetical protein